MTFKKYFLALRKRDIHRHLPVLIATTSAQISLTRLTSRWPDGATCVRLSAQYNRQKSKAWRKVQTTTAAATKTQPTQNI